MGQAQSTIPQQPIITQQIVLSDGTIQSVVVTQPVTTKPLLQSDTAINIINKQNNLITKHYKTMKAKTQNTKTIPK